MQALIHIAAESVVVFPMTNPKRFFQINIVGGMSISDVMLNCNVRKLVFSSNAAVYGEPEITPIDECCPEVPINSHGESKLMFEHI